MSFERNRFGFDGEITFECDKCGQEIHTDLASFPDAKQAAKEYGWRLSPSQDLCPVCGDE